MNQLDEFTVRFPSAFLGTLGVLLTYLAGAILWGRSAGLVAALILSTSFEWRQAAKVARVDMTLTFVLLCAFLFFLLLVPYRRRKEKGHYFGFYLGSGNVSQRTSGFRRSRFYLFAVSLGTTRLVICQTAPSLFTY